MAEPYEDFKLDKYKSDAYLASLSASAAVKALKEIFATRGIEVDPVYLNLESAAEAFISKFCEEIVSEVAGVL
ncbi:MAG: hypothetical protein AB1491_00335 [Thermodesulfobacteriota bacterium]